MIFFLFSISKCAILILITESRINGSSFTELMKEDAKSEVLESLLPLNKSTSLVIVYLPR